ncbi:hypothetical protein CsSME_00048717 [Camellia sinensis var. sinensis]
MLRLLKSSQDFSNLEPSLRRLRTKHGPILTLHIGSWPSVFITTREVAHRALVQNATIFANRPQAIETVRGANLSPLKYLGPIAQDYNHHTVSSAAYGSLWKVLRQNLASVFHPSRLNVYSGDIVEQPESRNKAILVQDHFQHVVFYLLAYMCFGDKLEEKVIKDIEAVQRLVLANFIRFNVLNFMPRLGKIVFQKLWKELLEIRKKQEDVLIPLVRQRRKKINNTKGGDEGESIVSYVNTLCDLQLPQENNAETELSEGEMLSLLKHQEIQEKLYREINAVVKRGEEIKEQDLEKMPYLEAILLETLRRHPPEHFILPRAVTENTVMEGYDIPMNAMVNFTVVEMGWDPNVWEDPMKFRPERFMSEEGGEEKMVFDIKGATEIKMMPFGAGRRVCPAITLALLHQKYFVANLVRDFKWTSEGGEEVDLSEKQDFTMVMKNPLQVHITIRMN